MNRNFQIALDDYLIHLEIERGLSDKTVLGYQFDLRVFEEYLDNYIFDNNWNLKDIKSRHIRLFLAYLKKERKNSPEAMNRKIVVLHTFFRFLIRTEEYDIKKDPSKDFKKLKTEKKLPKYLALYQLFLQTGCRISEVSGLELSNLSFKEKYIKIKGKGNKERIIPLTDT